MVHATLLAAYDLAAKPDWFLVLVALGFLALVWAYRSLSAAPTAPRPGTVLLVALLLRAALLPLPPTLSDDLLRYTWDGRVVMAGWNPYRWPPEAVELTPLRDELWSALPHKEVATVYPPLALAGFSIASASPLPFLALKSLLVLADLSTCALLLAIARRRGLPARRVLWYAWNPLVTLEVAGMGHVDALALPGLVAAVFLLTAPAPRPGAAGLGAALGILAKLGPLPALPLLARSSGRPRRFLLAALVPVAAAAVPILWATGGVPPGLLRYGVSWEWNGPLYEPLWRLLAALRADVLAARALELVESITRQWTLFDPLYPYLYPQLLAKLLLGAGMLAAVLAAVAERDLITGLGRLFGRLLLLSATLYPWYLLWVLPWAALAGQRAWLWLTALVALSYLPQHTAMDLWPGVFAALWLPFWALLARWPRWSTG